MQQTIAASSLQGTNWDTSSFVELEIACCILHPGGLRKTGRGRGGGGGGESSSPSLGVNYCPKTQITQPSRTHFTFQLQLWYDTH